MQGISPVMFNSVSMVTATLGANDPSVGDICFEGDEKYIFVYNNGTTQISKGRLATVSALTGYSVTVSTTTSLDIAVGVCKHATLTTATYGWLLQKGFGPCASNADESLSAGNLLTVGGNGACVAKTISTGYPTPVLGKVMIATASAGVGEAFFNICG
jgi:hypothetical protein